MQKSFVSNIAKNLPRDITPTPPTSQLAAETVNFLFNVQLFFARLSYDMTNYYVPTFSGKEIVKVAVRQ